MPTSPFRIAVVTTQYSPISHADVIVSRWLEPRESDAAYGWSNPKSAIASMHVEQILDNDISTEICRRHGITRYGSIREALCLGGSELAVDAVLLIAEHGDYPRNEFGQKLYPRKELFDQVAAVFQACGRVVPVFFDKHLSWSPASISAMYWTIRELNIPFFGGSSIPHSPLSAEIPEFSQAPTELAAMYFNEIEDYLFHSLELTRSLLERLPQTPADLVSITAWKGQSVWDALEASAISASLFREAALVVSDEAFSRLAKQREECGPSIAAFQLEYAGGFRETHIFQDFVRKWSLACPTGNQAPPFAAYVRTGTAAEFYPHFARLNRLIEDFFLSGIAPISLDRLYLTSTTTAACMEALACPGIPLPTPHIRLPVPKAAA